MAALQSPPSHGPRGRRVSRSGLSRRGGSLLILVAALLGVVFIVATREQPGSPVNTPGSSQTAGLGPAPEVGSPAPGFSLQTADGGQIALEDLRGQVVLVNLWATWCPPCRAEMPAIQAAYERYSSEGFTVLAVNQGEAGEVAAAFMREHSLTFPALLDPYGEVSYAYQVGAYPSSFFIGRDGVIRSIYKGPMSHSVIAGTVEALLAER